MPDVCRTCKAPVTWAVTAGGHRMPVDRDPVVDGNLRLEHNPGGRGTPRVVVVPRSHRLDGEWLWVAHFRTCPDADEHRRRR